ncbi:MAG: hypothetical protein NC092_10080 [Butyrivibrio sp.]|nr:hypothetical protein [Muribaculum sp.]MCM1553027.1 hypothetical protein [Butyrivibrio sp.]
MSYGDEKREAAMRLFGALSGVDEKYLEACEGNCNYKNNNNIEGIDNRSREKNGSAGGRSKSGIAVFVRRYGRSVAAVLTLAVLGGSIWAYQAGNIRDKDETTADASGGAMNEAMIGEASAPRAGNPERAEEPRAGASMGLEANGEGGSQINGAESYVLQSLEGALQEDNEEKLDQEYAQPDDFQGIAEKQKQITQLEASKLAVVGDYLPEVWPTQGSISQISCDDTAGEESLTIQWSYGDHIDGFELSILNMGDTPPVTMADVSKPESYDERLYDISHGESVPDEYKQVYADAVFSEEEFTKECVAARIVAYLNDTGDAISYKGSFGVLYQTEDGDSVLVRFHGRGSVDEIWAMLDSIDIP